MAAASGEKFDLDSVTLFEVNGSKGKYMLNVGAPDEATLAAVGRIIQEATAAKFAEDPKRVAKIMQYGRPDGDPQFLMNVAEWLSTIYKDPVSIENLVATAGASSGLFYTLAQLFSEPKKTTIFCEEYSYMIALESMRALNYNIVSVPIVADGLDVDALEAAFEKHLANASTDIAMYSAMLYCIPVFHNPTGVTLSSDKCSRVVELARKYNVLVFCDDVYNLLCYSGDGVPPKRLFAYDSPSDAGYRGGNVISNGSFSKLLGPGLRLGWMEMPPKVRKPMWMKSPLLDSGGCLNMFMCSVVAKGLEIGLIQPFVESVRNDLKERCSAVVSILKENIGSFCDILVPQGGYFIWVILPEGMSNEHILTEASRRYDLRFQLGQRFYTGKEPAMNAKRSIRLSIGFMDREKLAEGLSLLCGLIKEMAARQIY